MDSITSGKGNDERVGDASKAKQAAGRAAADWVQDGMVVGLGTGTTANFFIEALGERVRDGLSIQAATSSEASSELAKARSIPLLEHDQLEHLDLTIDGADEIDPQKRMIKGGGGALLREKIVAAASDEMVVIVDSSKCVDALGVFPLPVEVVPFGWRATQRKLPLPSTMRLDSEGRPFLTDNGHYILDLQLDYPLRDPEALDALLQAIPGIVETGLFLGLAGRVVVGHPDGHIEVIGVST